MEFSDADSGDRAYIGVRNCEGSIGLCLSRQHDGDVEVFMTPEVCEKLVASLREAIAQS